MIPRSQNSLAQMRTHPPIIADAICAGYHGTRMCPRRKTPPAVLHPGRLSRSNAVGIRRFFCEVGQRCPTLASADQLSPAHSGATFSILTLSASEDFCVKLANAAQFWPEPREHDLPKRRMTLTKSPCDTTPWKAVRIQRCRHPKIFV